VTAGKKAPTASAPIAAKKLAATKIPKEERFVDLGKHVREIEKRLDAMLNKRIAQYFDLVTSRGVVLDKTDEDEIIAKADQDHDEVVACAISEVRNYVGIDQTEPLAVKHVGRALRELGAVDEPSAKNRIEIFAFFHDGPQSGVLKRLAAHVKYEGWAKQAHKHLTSLRIGSKTKTAFTASNNVSNTLLKPIERLEDLALAKAVLQAETGKRLGNFLTLFAQRVFDRWPPWPAAKSGGSAPSRQWWEL
jgi:hypothetical protein